MIEEIRALLDEYVSWLRDKTILRKIDDRWIEITSPYMDRHNDYLQIYAKRHNGGFLLTDDGATIQDLEQTGCELNTPKRKALLDMTLNGLGVRYNNGALEVNANTNNFPLVKHNLIQAMLAVNDLFYTSKPMVSSLFYEDVVHWLDLNQIRYVSKVKFSGKTGYDHLFDFAIPRSSMQPERIVRAINKPDRNSINNLVFSWVDTREARALQAPDSKAYALLNDLERDVSTEVEALKPYEIIPVPWSKRAAFRDELAA